MDHLCPRIDFPLSPCLSCLSQSRTPQPPSRCTNDEYLHLNLDRAYTSHTASPAPCRKPTSPTMSTSQFTRSKKSKSKSKSKQAPTSTPTPVPAPAPASATPTPPRSPTPTTPRSLAQTLAHNLAAWTSTHDLSVSASASPSESSNSAAAAAAASPGHRNSYAHPERKTAAPAVRGPRTVLGMGRPRSVGPVGAVGR